MPGRTDIHRATDGQRGHCGAHEVLQSQRASCHPSGQTLPQVGCCILRWVSLNALATNALGCCIADLLTCCSTALCSDGTSLCKQPAEQGLTAATTAVRETCHCQNGISPAVRFSSNQGTFQGMALSGCRRPVQDETTALSVCACRCIWSHPLWNSEAGRQGACAGRGIYSRGRRRQCGSRGQQCVGVSGQIPHPPDQGPRRCVNLLSNASKHPCAGEACPVQGSNIS